MDLTPFKLDIDELIHEFSESKSTTLADMKRIWLSRKFSFIYEARPTTNVTFFMQSLYAHSIGHMLSKDSLSQRLGGLYCLYCLYETQPFKPPFRIYLSLGELQRLKHLVVDAKEEKIMVVPALVKRMLDKNVFLFGFVDINEGSVSERVKEINNLQNARMQVAYNKLLTNTRIEQFLHMDLGMELDQKVLKKMSTEYAAAKELAIKEAEKKVDVENIKHITENKNLIGDVVEKMAEDWNAQKEVFYEKTGFNRRQNEGEKQVMVYEEEQQDDDFGEELEHLLC
ncbi:Small nuclear RNA activating complex (SNAPc) [Macleaya cordata]|uniref:Small nuclear RNA activating complex (SNAPc) n=1 Tax=Macleaya cordata TaxID=56857 RepID=A0A200PNR1_MACCD|nr:Small nuclear RNA activating complex (SNAPc) [Macleaya cordata]